MFGRLNLMKDGAQVDGVVVESKTEFSRVSRDPEHPDAILRLMLQVQFEDGVTSEVEGRLKIRDIGGTPLNDDGLVLSAGDTVPMRYDPEDRSRIEIDVPAMEAKHREQAEASKVTVQSLADLQVAKQRGEISQEEFTKQAERLLDLD